MANHAAVAVQNGRLIDELRHEALHDALTGLPNRVLLRQMLDGALEAVAGPVRLPRRRDDPRPGRLQGRQRHPGARAGDELLQEVAERLRAAVGRAGTVARLGGDEFAVVLPDCGDDEAVLRVARRLVASFLQPIELDDSEVEVGGLGRGWRSPPATPRPPRRC